MTNDTQTMLKEYVAYIAAPKRIPVSRVSIIEGRNVGCIDTHLLNITSRGQIASVLVYQSDLDKLENGLSCDRLEFQIRATLSKLSSMLEI
jgi:hypothetical protein